MLLYHGTNSIRLEKILQEGLSSPYLTNSESLASYYAEVSYEEEGGEPILLEVEVDETKLLLDQNAMDEPVSYDDFKIADLEEIVEERMEILAKEHPDWMHNSYLRIPSHLYQISLETVASCKTEETIPVSKIEIM